MKRRSIASLALLLATIAPSSMAAAQTWTGATSSDWQEATNWSGGVVPDADKRAVINTNPATIGTLVSSVDELWVGTNGNNGILNIQNGGIGGSISSTLIGVHSGSTGTIVVDGSGSTLNNSDILYVGALTGSTGILNVQNGGNVIAGAASIGYNAGTTGTATVTGTGSLLESVNLRIGHSGNGALTIENGGKAESVSDTLIGVSSGSTGTVTVTDTGAALGSGRQLLVGSNGTGTLTISGGGKASSADTHHTAIGASAGSTGTATVTGAGSLLESGNDLYIGRDGGGTLTIADGGTATSKGNTIIGRVGGATGIVGITGTGSLLEAAGSLYVGNVGNGTLTIAGGGSASSEGNTFIGNNTGATGLATVTGAGSLLESTSNLYIGREGRGTLSISNGGTVKSTAALRIAFNGGSSGTLNIGAAAGDAAVAAGVIDAANIQFGAGAGKIVFNHTDDDYTLSSSISGAGTVDVLSGTTTLSGANGGFTGAINIQDGTLQASNTLGGVTTGATTITNGTYNILNGAVVNNAMGTIGNTAGSNGTASVSGIGSQWISNGQLRVGHSGNGTLTIENGGKVESASHTYLGSTVGGNGTATVTGSSLNSGGQLRIGNDGTGTLTLSDGGVASSADTFYTSIGYRAGSTGTVTLTDFGTVLASGHNLNVGTGGNGTLTVLNGAKASSANHTYIGDTSSGFGTATVSGSGSLLESGSFMYVGNSGTGTLAILDSGRVESAGHLYLGNAANSTGTVTVTGSGSALASDGQLRIGLSGTGTLTVSNNGKARSAGTMHIALDSGSSGTLNIGAAAGEAAAGSGEIDAANIQFGDGTGKIVFNHTDDNYTLSSNISGAGVMDFLAGTSVLTGNNNGFTGIVNVDGGILRVNGVMGALTTTVETGARFEGNASIGNLIVNSGGTLAPGNSIGVTNTVDATFNPGSIYDVELNAAGQSDLLAATGVVTINGGTVHVIPYPDYALGTPYTIITAAGGVAGGGFDALTSAAPYVTGSLVYNPNDVQLVLSATPGGLIPVAQTHNQRGVARAAANVSGNAAIGALLFSPDAASARRAMDQLSGEIHASLTAAQIREQETLRTMVLRRKPDAQVDAGQSSVWMQAFGSFGQSGSDGNAATLDTVSGGAMIGVESRTEHGYLGAGIGHSVQQIDVDARHSDASARNYHALVYGGGRIAQTGIELDGGASLTWHDNETRRDVRIGTFSGASAADYHGQSGQVFARVGYRFEGAQTAVKPYVEGAYVHHHASGYRENGIAGLKGGASNANAGFATLGIEAERGVALNDEGARILLTGGLGWRHLIGGENVEKRHSWDGAANSDFTVRGVPLEREAVLFDAGVSADLAPGVTAGIAYSGSLGADSLYHAVSARAGIRF